MGLLHNLGDGRRHTARAFAPWRSHRRGEIFMTAISRHGDTHRHLATHINLWRHPSPYGDTHHHMATGIAKARRPRELDHILLSNAVPMLSKRWLPRCWACCTTLATAVAAKIAVPRRSRNGEMGRDSLHCTTRCLAVARQLSRNGDSCRGTATHIAERRRISRKGDEDHQSATA